MVEKFEQIDVVQTGERVQTIEGVEADEEAEIRCDLHRMFLLRSVG
jgi:hypothetical protein